MKNNTVMNLAVTTPSLVARWTPWEQRGALPAPDRLGYLQTHDPSACDEVAAAHADISSRLESLNALEAIRDWFAQSRDYRDERTRTAALRTLELLTPLAVPPLITGDRNHPDPAARKRLLLPIEWGAVRLTSRRQPTSAVAVALCEAGAGSTDLQGVHADRFSWAGGAWNVELAGSARIRPRVVTLASWVNDMVDHVLGAPRHLDDVLYTGSRPATDVRGRVAAIDASITAVLQDLDLHRDASVSAASLAHTGARAAYDQHDGAIEIPAAMLGQRNLTRVAERIGVAAHHLSESAPPCRRWAVPSPVRIRWDHSRERRLDVRRPPLAGVATGSQATAKLPTA